MNEQKSYDAEVVDPIDSVAVADSLTVVPLDEAQRLSYLAAMGIPVWLARDYESIVAEEASTQQPVVTSIDQPFQPQATPNSALSVAKRDPVLIPPVVAPAVITPQVIVPTSSFTDADWDVLATRVTQCQLCQELVANRSRTVFGVGNRHASLLVVGEAPGADEDQQGEPFVGRAGQLLNAMLVAIGLKREEIYIANILKCRPPNNRDPQKDEAMNCQSFLLRQIELLAPQLMLAVGRNSAQNLLNTQITIGKLRGRVHEYGEKRIPLVVTYHPAYLLRSPGQKAEAWKDLQIVARILQQH